MKRWGALMAAWCSGGWFAMGAMLGSWPHALLGLVFAAQSVIVTTKDKP